MHAYIHTYRSLICMCVLSLTRVAAISWAPRSHSAAIPSRVQQVSSQLLALSYIHTYIHARAGLLLRVFNYTKNKHNNMYTHIHTYRHHQRWHVNGREQQKQESHRVQNSFKKYVLFEDFYTTFCPVLSDYTFQFNTYINTYIYACIHTPTTWSNVCMYVITAPNEVQIEKLSRELDSLAWQLVTTAHTYIHTYIHTYTNGLQRDSW